MSNERKSFQDEADDQWTRLVAAAQANLARYVFDATGQCRGRCTGHDQGDHHPLCARTQQTQQ